MKQSVANREVLSMLKKPEINYMENVGFIGNYFTEQLLSHDFNIKILNKGACERTVLDNNISVVFIDAEFFNIDNSWVTISLKEVTDYIESLDLNIIIISYRNRIVDNRFFHLFIGEKEFNDTSGHESVSYKINEKLINPVNSKKTNDLIVLNITDTLSNITPEKNASIVKRLEKDNYNISMVNIKNLSRENLMKLVGNIKKSKVIFVPNPELINKYILEYLELVCALQGTFLIMNKYNNNSSSLTKYSVSSYDENNILHYIKSFYQQGILNDHLLLQKSRSAFLNHTFLRSNDLVQIINGNHKPVEPIKISVVTSTVRKNNLEKYIQQMNNQNFVELEIILLTHGFQLNEDEKNVLQKFSKHPIKFLSQSLKTVYGKCLNICIENMSYKYFAKIDDDDFYYPNYLIDSWISLKYSNASIVGKHSTFWYFQEQNMVAERFYNQSEKFTKYIAGATLFCNSYLIKKYKFSLLASGIDFDLLNRLSNDNQKIYCNKPYEFCVFRDRDINSHTWKVDNLYLLRSASIRFFGDPSNSLTVSNNKKER